MAIKANLHIVVNVNVIVTLDQVNDEAFCHVPVNENSWRASNSNCRTRFLIYFLCCKSSSDDRHSLIVHISCFHNGCMWHHSSVRSLPAVLYFLFYLQFKCLRLLKISITLNTQFQIIFLLHSSLCMMSVRGGGVHHRDIAVTDHRSPTYLLFVRGSQLEGLLQIWWTEGLNKSSVYDK